MSFLRAILKPSPELLSDCLARMACWLVEAAGEDPGFFVLLAMFCAALWFLWLIFMGVGAAVRQPAGS